MSNSSIQTRKNIKMIFGDTMPHRYRRNWKKWQKHLLRKLNTFFTPMVDKVLKTDKKPKVNHIKTVHLVHFVQWVTPRSSCAVVGARNTVIAWASSRISKWHTMRHKRTLSHVMQVQFILHGIHYDHWLGRKMIARYIVPRNTVFPYIVHSVLRTK